MGLLTMYIKYDGNRIFKNNDEIFMSDFYFYKGAAKMISMSPFWLEKKLIWSLVK